MQRAVAVPTPRIPKPVGFWRNKQNHRKFMDNLASQFGHKTLDDWYQVTHEDLEKKGAMGLLSNYYDWSLAKALMANYPEHNWLFWKFQKLPRHCFDDLENQKKFMEYVGKELGITSMEQWYSVDSKEITKRHGSVIGLMYGRSMCHLLQAVYPEYPWLPWKFAKTPKGFWNVVSNQKKFCNWVMQQKNFSSLDDWYNLTSAEFCKLGGTTLLYKEYNYSLGKLLKAVYPEHDWQMWRFERVPHGFWSDEANIVAFFQYCTKQFSITHLSDWLNVERVLIRKAGGTTLLSRFGGIIPLLQHVYPSYNWTAISKRHSLHNRDSRFTSKAERYLQRQLQKLLPDVEIIKDYRHKDLTYKNTNRWMEFDMFLPSLTVAIEYHGEQHYQQSYLFGSEVHQQVRDEDKRQLCKEKGITLIEIPYWWDRTTASLAATLHKHLPTLVEKPEGAQPIPEQPPSKKKESAVST